MRRVTIGQVATLAGTSISTVSKVLNNVPNSGIPERTAQRVRHAAEQLQYIPLATARSLRHQSTRTIAVMAHDLSPHAASIIAGVEETAAARQYATVLALHRDQAELEGKNLLIALRGQVDGLIVLPARGGANVRLYELLRRQGVPFVFVDRHIPGFEAHYVGVRNEEAAYRLTRALIVQGARRIRGIFGWRGNTALEQRYLGFRRALVEADLCSPTDTDIARWGEYGACWMQECLELRPPVDGLFWGTYHYLQPVLNVLVSRGLRVPEDLHFAGFDKVRLVLSDHDDYEALRAIAAPWPAAIQPSYEMGRRASELLFRSLEGTALDATEQILLDPYYSELPAGC